MRPSALTVVAIKIVIYGIQQIRRKKQF